MKEFNILFLGGAKRVSLAESFIESGKKRGLAIKIFSYELDDQIPISFIGRVIIGKKWSDPAILSHLEEVVSKYNINALLPSVDPSTIIASKFKSFTRTECFVPVPSLALCNIFFNKQLAYDWCLQNQIPVPDAEIIFPLIAKPNKGSASIGIQKISNQEEFNSFKNQFNINDYNIQRYIDGIEFSVDLYVSSSNRTIACIPRLRLEVLGGESIKSLTVRDNNIIALSQDLVAKSGLTGPLTIQFIQDKTTKEVFLMEVNPRFGGAVMCSIGAGADLPGFLLDDAVGIELIDQNHCWRSNVLMVRRFSEFYRELPINPHADYN